MPLSSTDTDARGMVARMQSCSTKALPASPVRMRIRMTLGSSAHESVVYTSPLSPVWLRSVVNRRASNEVGQAISTACMGARIGGGGGLYGVLVAIRGATAASAVR